MDRACPERLRQFVLGLLPEHPDLWVSADVEDIVRVPEGTTMVLEPQEGDADYLNLNRPIFARRRLKVVLWCAEETTKALATRAVDFFDWISHRHECPPGVAMHRVLGLRAAAKANAPIVVWMGHDLEDCFRVAFPDEPFVKISAKRPYPEIVNAVNDAEASWIVWEDVEGYAYRWWIVEQAMAETGRLSRTIIRTSYVRFNYPVIFNDCMDLRQACQRLEMAPAQHRGRLAALSDLEIMAIAFLRALLNKSGDAVGIERALMNADDPGVTLFKMLPPNSNLFTWPIDLRAHPESEAWNPARIDELRRNPQKLVEDVVSAALSAGMLAEPAEAMAVAERAVEVTAQICGHASDDHMLALIHLAKVVGHAGRFQQALEILESVDGALSRGAANPRVVFMLHDVWRDILRHSGQYENAEEKARRAVDAAVAWGNDTLVHDAENHLREIRALRERSS